MRSARSRVAVRWLGLAVAGTTVLALTGCGDVGAAFGGFGWPQGGITPDANRMYDLWVGAVIAALLVGFLVWGLIFWCVVRYRKRGDELPPQTRFNMPMEVLYSVTPILVIMVLFYYTWVIQNEVDDVTAPPDVTVEVVAFQWNWQFNYRDGTGADANTVASIVGDSAYIPVLVVPTGQTIRFELVGQDVIHSFWVPELLFKRDVFPGYVDNVYQTSILEGKEGAYVGRCAELCGTYHAMMNFELRAVTAAQFASYLEALESGLSGPEALASIGQDPLATTTEPFDTKRAAGN